MLETRMQIAEIINVCEVDFQVQQLVGAKIVPANTITEPANVLRAWLADQIVESEILQALLCGSNLPVLHLCSGLHLRFYSEVAGQVFGFSANDLGTKLEYIWAAVPSKDMAMVCRTGKSCMRLATGPDSAVWQCHILPHCPQEGSSPGVMVVLSANSSAVPLDQMKAANKTGLTKRQRQIMDLVLAGHPSKNIAADLKISQRTVENHRAAIMRRTGATSLPALARMAVGAARNADHRGENGLWS